jgi:hypothetical protein
VLRLRLQEQKQLGTLPIYFHNTAELRLKDPGMPRWEIMESGTDHP